MTKMASLHSEISLNTVGSDIVFYIMGFLNNRDQARLFRTCKVIAGYRHKFIYTNRVTCSQYTNPINVRNLLYMPADTNLEAFSKLTRLEIYQSYSIRWHVIPELASLEKLILDCDVKEIDSSLTNLTDLRVKHACGNLSSTLTRLRRLECDVKHLSNTFINLTRLSVLNLYDCSVLISMTKLRHLTVEHGDEISEGFSFGDVYLPHLTYLYLNTSDSVCNVNLIKTCPNLLKFCIGGADPDMIFPTSLTCLRCWQTEYPVGLMELTNLKKLKIDDPFGKWEILPLPKLNYLRIMDLESTPSDQISSLEVYTYQKHVTRLLLGCKTLLGRLILPNVTDIEAIDNNYDFVTFPTITKLRYASCYELTRLPYNLTVLRHLEIICSDITEIPKAYTALTSLTLHYCPIIEAVKEKGHDDKRPRDIKVSFLSGPIKYIQLRDLSVPVPHKRKLDDLE